MKADTSHPCQTLKTELYSNLAKPIDSDIQSFHCYCVIMVQNWGKQCNTYFSPCIFFHWVCNCFFFFWFSKFPRLPSPKCFPYSSQQSETYHFYFSPSRTLLEVLFQSRLRLWTGIEVGIVSKFIIPQRWIHSWMRYNEQHFPSELWRRCCYFYTSAVLEIWLISHTCLFLFSASLSSLNYQYCDNLMWYLGVIRFHSLCWKASMCSVYLYLKSVYLNSPYKIS